MAAGLSLPGKSREGPGTGQDRTGQDQDTLKVPWSCGPGTKIVQNNSAMATLGLKEMGIFFWEGREKGGREVLGPSKKVPGLLDFFSPGTFWSRDLQGP